MLLHDRFVMKNLSEKGQIDVKQTGYSAMHSFRIAMVLPFRSSSGNVRREMSVRFCSRSKIRRPVVPAPINKNSIHEYSLLRLKKVHMQKYTPKKNAMDYRNYSKFLQYTYYNWKHAQI